MSNLLKKLIFSFLSFFTVFTSIAPNLLVVRAQESTWYNQKITEWYSKVYDVDNPQEIFGERYTAAQVQWIVYSLIVMPLNFLGKENQEFVSCAVSIIGSETDLKACWDAYWNTTFLGKVLDLLPFKGISQSPQREPLAVIFDTTNRDFSGIKYIKDRISKFSLIPVANAQEGFGFSSLGLVQPFWSISRNLAYTFMVLFVVVFAFMIMFKVKISPQTVISVQSALPKIIGAIILATFSYAIAGLVIDLMYVVMGIIAGFLNPLPFSLGFDVMYAWISGSVLGGATSPLLILSYMLTYTILFFLLIVVNLASVFSSTWSVLSAILSILMLLVVVWLIILTIWYAIKIPWMLIKTLINIFISVIIAPIQITLGSVAPNIGFGLWLRNLIANVMVFPMVGIMFLFGYIFLAWGYVTVLETTIERHILAEILRALGLNINGFLPGNLWSPPFLGSGAEITPLIFALMSFGIIIAIPKATEILKAIIMGEKFSYGSAIGEATQAAKVGGAVGLYTAVGISKEHYPWPISTLTRDSPPPKWMVEWADRIRAGLEQYTRMTRGHFP